MLRSFLFVGVTATMMLGCSTGTHNTSRGTCHDIPVCKGQQCTTETDGMTQIHCEMVGGQYEPADHSESWFNF